MEHETILALIIFGAGGLAGLTNYLIYLFKDVPLKKGEFFKYFFSSVGAALLVPLLLNMLSSDLIKKTDNYNSLNYFVFAGFCFVAGYFSDRFINSIGEKILKDLENTKAKADTALSETRKTEEKLDILVSPETEVDDEINLSELKLESSFNDEDLKTQMYRIVNSFKGKYKFRTHTGIAKELNYTTNVVKIILEGLETNGAVKRFTKSDGKEVWGLTKIGLILLNKTT